MHIYFRLFLRAAASLVVLVMLTSRALDLVSLGVFLLGFITIITGRLSLSFLLIGLYSYLSLSEDFRVGLGRITLMVMANFAIVVNANIKCPRCLESLPTFKRSEVVLLKQPSDYCIVCGRTSHKVWPFQYALKPEVWDGQYHDEGAGPQAEDALLEWWRYVRGKAAIKRSAKAKL